MLGLETKAASSLLAVALAACAPGSTPCDGGLRGCIAWEYENVRIMPVTLQSNGSQAAVDEWRKRAERGEPSAQLALGTAYALGKGVERDLARAVSWLTRAAEAGNTTAQYNLGFLHVARGEFRDAYQWFVIASKRAGEQRMRDKAGWSAQLTTVFPPPQIRMAGRDAADWMEEFDANPRANSATDQRFEFRRLPVPDGAFGWRETAAALQSAARDILGMPK